MQHARRLTVRLLSSVLALCALCALGAQARGQDAPADEPEFELWIDRALLEGAFATPPLDVYSDARAKDAVAEMRLQLDRLSWLELHQPLAEALAAPRFLRFQAFRSGPGEFQNVDMVIRAGAAAARWCDMLEMQNAFQKVSPATCGSCEGVTTQGHDFVGTHEGDVVIGETKHAPILAMAGALADAPAPFVARSQGAVVVAMLTPDEGTPAEMAGLLTAVAPVPPGASPAVQSLASPLGGWTSSFAITGIGASSLRPPGPRLAAAVRPDQQLTLAFGVDRTWLGRLLSMSGANLVNEDVLKALAAHTTGDALLQASWGATPVPAGAIVLPVDDTAALAAALAAVPGAVSVPLPDKTPAWSIQLGMPMLIAAAQGELVLATDADTLGAALHASSAAPPPWASTEVLVLDADLHAIGAHLLPMAGMLLGSGSGPLADPYEPLRQLLKFTFGNPETIDPLANVRANHGLAAALDQLCQGGAEHLDQVIAVYAPPARIREYPTLIVLTADGYRILSPWAVEADRTVKTLAEAQKEVAGKRLRFGVGLDALRIMAPPAAPTIGAAWLPPMAAISDHLARYHLAVTLPKGTSLVMQDRGLPLAGIAGVAFTFSRYMEISMVRIQKEMQQRMQADMEKRKAEQAKAKAQAPAQQPAPVPAPAKPPDSNF